MGFATQRSVASDSLLDGAASQFLSSLGKSDNSKLPALEHTSDLKPQFKENTLSSGITPPDSTADSLKLIKSLGTQKKADSVRSRNIGLADSAAGKVKDSVHVMTWRDSLMVKSLDSTARLEQFRYQREDQPVTVLSPRKQSKFFARPSQSMISRTVELDSSGNFVNIKEKIGNRPYKIILTIPLDEYIKLQMDARNRDQWEALAYKYELKSDKKDIGQLITDITNIDIPLPSVGFLSIFGKRGINIRINGAVDIHGAWRNEKTEGVTASLLGNSRNEPDFKQNVQINVQGTIGDKLKIGADWNTERTFEYENQLKLTYTGYEDEIVQKVEAGNVSLQTSPLVGGSEALFGVKADFQLGPLKLTTLASQKKGEVKEVSVSGGTTAQDFQKRVYEYSTNHYFIDTVYASRYTKIFENFYSDPNRPFDMKYMVREIEVWKSVVGQRQQGLERQANAFIDLPVKSPNYDSYADPNGKNYRDTTLQPVSGLSEIGRFVRMIEGTDFEIHRETGYITFKTQIQEQDVIAVAYTLPDPNNPNDPTKNITFGDMIGSATDTTGGSSSKRLVLKLIKPANLQPSYTTAWMLQLRNIYAVGGRGINQEGFKLDIQYQIPGQEPQSQIQTPAGPKQLLESFGLDLVGAGNAPGRDGEFDFLPDRTIITQTGEIIFPKLQPFGEDIPAGFPDSLKFMDIYTKTITQARLQASKDRFVLKGKYSASSTSVFNLGMVGIVENSVKVTLGGRELQPNVDYVVDYMIGQVTIRNRDALVPGADLKITYEQNDIFQLASKTLLGARGEFSFSKKTQLGFSALNLNQQTLTDKVRIGEEPLDNSIYGIDFGTSADLPFLTKALDKLFSTREMSGLNFRGDFAFINPDPNTKKSPIVSDGGESIAYVDDFEGSKKTIPVGLGYTSWHDLSIPNGMTMLPSDPLVIMNYKARSWWHNITPSDVATLEIWPQKKVSKNDRTVTVLDWVFDPSLRGTYNYNTNFIPNARQNWGGMMKILSSTANNLEDENIEFIEFWLQIEKDDPKNGAQMIDSIYIDLGKISQDVIPNNRLDTEDKPVGQGNGLLDNGEDVGIDGMNNDQERAYATEKGYASGSEADPSGDDFNFTPVGPTATGYYNTDAYISINGTDNNSKSIEAGKLPDTEDLKNSLTLEQVNSYFRYSVPLDTVKANNKYIVGGGNTLGNWHQIRIPLKEFTSKYGSPSLSVVEYIRVWVNNVEHRIHLRFADFNLVGSQWQKVAPRDSAINGLDKKLELSVISIDENSPEYYSPQGVSKEKDMSKPDEEVYRNEQSLNLILHSLEGQEERQVIKTVRSMDLFNYKALKMFIHGDDNPDQDNLSWIITEDPLTTNGEVYFRFGADTTNYYEFRQPISPGWKEVSIPFAEITALKSARDAARDTTKTFYQRPFYAEVPGKPGHYYGIRGNPALTTVTFYMVGVRNPHPKNSLKKVSGKVWVDEMRVIGADNHSGWAYSGSASLKLADVATVSFNLSQTDPYFHKLSDRFGSRMDSRNWSVALDLDVIKIMPFSMPGSKLRLNYQRSESVSKPLYKPGTDIKLEEASQELERQMISRGRSNAEAATSRDSAVAVSQSLNVSETWSLSSIELRIPSTFWLIQETINNLRFSFSFNKTEGRNPTLSSNKSWVWNFGASYALTFGQNNFFYLADIPVFGTVLQLFTDYRNTKFYYSPQNLSLNLTTSRNYSYSLSRITGVSPSVSRDFRQSRNGAFQWKFTEGGLLNLAVSYNVDVSSSLAHLLTVNNLYERRERDIWRDFIGSQFFGRDFQYSQNFDLRTSPRLPSIWNLNNYFTLNAGYNTSYSWANNFQQTYAGRSAGYSNKISFGMKVKLKSLFEPMFQEDKEDETANRPTGNTRNTNRTNRSRSREEEEVSPANQQPANQQPANAALAKADSLAKTDSLSVLAAKKDSTRSLGLKLKSAWVTVRGAIKYALFDYENISLNFSQDNTLQKNGIKAEGTGFTNFWGIFRNNNSGPSRLFMLGIGSDVGPRVTAPDTGAQAVTVSLSDNFSQRNSLDFGTQKPLWDGAQLDLKWKVAWSMNKNTVFQVDRLGGVTASTVTANGTLTRSFVTFPPVFFLSFLGNSGIKKVSELYTPGSNLSEAFLKGFESLPLLSKIPFLNQFARYIPRPNWTLNWDGLEKISVFKSFAKRVSLNHAYSAEYSEGWMLNQLGTQVTQSQKINYGFQPLLGLTMTFNSLWNGNMTGNMKYSTRTGYDLGITTSNITESFSRDIGVSFSYSKTGFDLPLFGVNLKNDVEISFSYTNTKTAAVVYNMTQFTEAGIPQDGTVRTTLEPRIKYVISSRVTASVYYKRSSVQPEGAARITPTTTNEAGLDVHVSIQ